MAQTIGTAYVKVLPDPRGLSEFHSRVQKSIGSIKLNVDQSKGAFAPLGKISADLNQFQNSLDASVARTLAFGASVGVIGGAVRSIKAVIDSFIEVEKSIADINAVFKLTAPELKGFTAGLFDVARDTAQSFKDVATAATEFSRQGLSVGETLKRTESAMKLVRLAGLETTQAVNVLTAAMNGFSSAGLESQEIVNKLATVDAAYAVSSSDLALALSRAGDTAQGAKVSFDELLGAVTAVQQRTARGGAIIGNGLKSIFTRLQRSKVQGALEDVGVATKDADGNIRESMSILKDYAGVYNTLSDSQRAFTDEQIAGVYQINTLKALVRDLTNEYGVYNGAVRTSTEATDEAEKRMAALSQTTDAKLKRISASFAEFSSMGGKDIFGPMISRLANVAEGALGAVNSAMKSDNKGLGGTLLSGITEGLGSFLAGPGLIIGLKAAVKLVGFLGKEAITAARQVSQIGSESQKRVQLEQQVLGLLQTDSSLVAQIASGTLNAANANRLIETSLTKQLQLSERIASFQKNVGAFVASNPAIIASHAAQFGGKARRFAGGYAPTIRKEKNAIAQGVGGARSGDKPVVIPEFNYGGGKRGPAVAHTGEWFVPHFNGGSAIFNRDMAESYGLPSGAVRVGMANGHVPNFAPPRTNILGTGSYGQFHQYQKRPEIGFKRLFSGRDVRDEFEKSKAAHEALAKNQFVGAPKVLGSLEGSKRRSRVGKQVVGRDLGQYRRYDLSDAPWQYEEALEAVARAGYASAKKSGFRVGDDKLSNIAVEKGDILSFTKELVDRFGNIKISAIKSGLSEIGVDKSDLGSGKQQFGKDYSRRLIKMAARSKFEDALTTDVVEKMAIERGLRLSLVDPSMASGYVPNFIDFRSSTPSKVKSKRGFAMQYLLGDKVPKGSSAIVDQLRSDPYVAQIDKTFKSLGLPEPKASIRDFLVDTDNQGKLFSSTGGVYYPKTGASIVGQRGAQSTDFIGILGHEVGGHHLDYTFKNSPMAQQKGISGNISDDPRFVSKFKRVYGAWKSKGPDAKISPVLKRIFSRIEESGDIYSGQKALRREVFADISQYLYGRGSNKLTMRTGIGKFVNSITGATSFAGGYDPLGQAVSREADAVGSSKVRVGTHPSLKAPHNPMGIGVYNSSEGSLSNGIRMARAAGIEPKTKGMADGHVPNFANKISLDNRLDDALATFRMRLEDAGDDMKRRTEAERDYRKSLQRIGSDAKKRGMAAPKAGSATSEAEFRQLSVAPNAASAIKRIDRLFQSLEKGELATVGRSQPPQSGMIPLRPKSVDDPTPRANRIPSPRLYPSQQSAIQNTKAVVKEALLAAMARGEIVQGSIRMISGPPNAAGRFRSGRAPISAPLRQQTEPTLNELDLINGGQGVTANSVFDKRGFRNSSGIARGGRVSSGEAAFVRSTNLSNLNMRGVDAPNGIGSQLRGIGRRAFSYTPEEQARGKGQGRFMQAFGAQIAGGIIRSMGEGTKRERETAAFSSGLDAAATALTLIPGPAGAVAAGLAGVGTAAYQWFSSFNDQVGPLRKSLEEQAMAANKSAQALSDATQAYSAYESAMKSSDPARMATALSKLTDKIFAIGNADPEAMQQALGAIGSSNPQEAFANAQEIIAKRQAAIERNSQLLEGAQKAGGINNPLIRDLITFKDGITSEQGRAAIQAASLEAASGNLESAIDKLADVLEGGRTTADAVMKGAYGKGLYGTITDPEKKQSVQRLGDILIGKTRNLGNLEDFKKAIEGPAKEVSASQLRLAKVSRDFGMELERASGALSFLSYSVEKGFKDQMEFRNNSFKSSLEALQTTGDISEARGIGMTGKRNAENINNSSIYRRNFLRAELKGSGSSWAQAYVGLEGASQAGTGKLNDLFSKASGIVGNKEVPLKDAVDQMKLLFSDSSLKGLGLGGSDEVDKLLKDLSKAGADSITELQKIKYDTEQALAQNKEQTALQQELYDVSAYLESAWAKGFTQKDSTDVAEAIRRIEMAKEKSNLTVSQREQLGVDYGILEQFMGPNFQGTQAYQDQLANKSSLNAALFEQIAKGNTNYTGGLATPSNETETNAILKKIQDSLIGRTDGTADFLGGMLDTKTKYEQSAGGLVLGMKKPFDWTAIDKGLSDMSTETSKVAERFKELEKATIAAKEAQINLSIAANDEAARQAKYDAIDQSERQYKQKRKELEDVVRNAGELDASREYGSASEVGRRAQTDLIKLEETRKNEESTRFSTALTNLEGLLKRMHEKMTDPASEGGADVTQAEIGGSIRVELASAALSYELRKALEESFQASSEKVLDELVKNNLKKKFDLAKP